MTAKTSSTPSAPCTRWRWEPGKGQGQDAYIERLNRTYRHQVLDAYVFKSIEQVEHITVERLSIYNEWRPHETLGRLPPKQFLPKQFSPRIPVSGCLLDGELTIWRTSPHGVSNVALTDRLENFIYSGAALDRSSPDNVERTDAETAKAAT